MTVTERARDAILGHSEIIEKTELPGGIRAACVERDGIAVILVDVHATPADQMVLALNERLALIRRRCEAVGRCPRVAMLTAGLMVCLYLAISTASVFAATTRSVLIAVGCPLPIRGAIYATTLTVVGMVVWQALPFVPNIWGT